MVDLGLLRYAQALGFKDDELRAACLLMGLDYGEVLPRYVQDYVQVTERTRAHAFADAAYVPAESK